VEIADPDRESCHDLRMVEAEWPAWAIESVKIVESDPGWQVRGERQRHELDRDLAAWLISPVEHIGSTAVPGLAAKPVLDCQAQVADLECATQVAAVLVSRGWHAVPVELDGRPWERFFVQVAQDRRCAHLHLLGVGSSQWFAHLEFRDALRASPSLAAEYGGLKTTLAIAHRNDREAYTRAKAEFITKTLAQ